MDTTVKLKLGFAALMIASGIGVAMYPVISNAVAQRHASSVIESYNDTVQTMDTEKIDAAKEAARRYNEQLSNAIDRDAAGEAPIPAQAMWTCWMWARVWATLRSRKLMSICRFMRHQ